MSSIANYGSKVPSTTAYVKQFYYGSPAALWVGFPYKVGTEVIPTVTTASKVYDNVYIPGNLYVDGTIFNPSDIHLKENITNIDNDVSNKIMNINPTQFTFKSDSFQHVHYGFVAQDFEKEFPELVSIKPDKDMANIKAINYLEIIPLLVSKIQMMQKEIDVLKEEIKGLR